MVSFVLSNCLRLDVSVVDLYLAQTALTKKNDDGIEMNLIQIILLGVFFITNGRNIFGEGSFSVTKLQLMK